MPAQHHVGYTVTSSLGNNQNNDRTFITALGGQVIVRYGGSAVQADVPVLKTLGLHVTILNVKRREEGQIVTGPAIPKAEIAKQVAALNELYAQAGIQVNLDATSPQVADAPKPADLWDGGKDPGYDMSPDRKRMLPDETAILGAAALRARGKAINVYVVNNIKVRERGDVIAHFNGWSYPVSLTPSKYANSVAIMGGWVTEDMPGVLVGHEIGHDLLNEGSHNPRMTNLMFESQSYKEMAGDVRATKRLTPQQGEKMRANPSGLLEDPPGKE